LLVGSRDRGKENVKRDTHLDAARREDISTDEHLGKIRDVERFANPADDPDIGEIIVVRRKKSRAALDGLQWDAAALTEATNATSAQKEGAPLKVKIEDKDMQKWWSIGRGVKELKEKKSLLGIKSRAKRTPN
jgi:serine/arginine repetitive matrix protein 2